MSYASRAEEALDRPSRTPERDGATAHRALVYAVLDVADALRDISVSLDMIKGQLETLDIDASASVRLM